jgi:hypothetical protein
MELIALSILGTVAWPYACSLKLVNGLDLGQSRVTLVSSLEANQECDISIELTSPSAPGIYQSHYRLYTPTGTPFGDPIWLVLNVEAGGVLGITQQLNNVNIFGANNKQQENQNFDKNSIRNNAVDDRSVFTNNPFNFNRVSVSELNDTNNNLEDNSVTKKDDEPKPDFYDDMFS